jgi:hypothetical protein
MIALTPRPKPRGRWLVVGMLLFVVSVAGWWFWPRGDTRLVGSWHSGGHESRRLLVFRSNGWVELGEAPGMVVVMPYRTEGDRLIYGNQFGGRILDSVRPAVDWWKDMTGRYYMPLSFETSSSITFEGTNTLWLKHEEAEEPIRYTRLPE